MLLRFVGIDLLVLSYDSLNSPRVKIINSSSCDASLEHPLSHETAAGDNTKGHDDNDEGFVHQDRIYLTRGMRPCSLQNFDVLKAAAAAAALAF